jgi:6-phosphogluconate dehydrogenase
MLGRLVSSLSIMTQQLSIGVPVTLIGEAVFARCLSSIKEERVRASKHIAGPQKEPFRGDKQLFIDDLEQALYASKIISYTQGFMLMRETAKEVCKLALQSDDI